MTMTIRDSVSAVFACGDEIFMIGRQPYLPAFPGYHAFPGGKVDRAEFDSPFGIDMLDRHQARIMHALVRELKEELGYDLVEACRQGQVASLDELCSATTPEFEQFRFHNRFFRIELTNKPDFAVDGEEAAWAEWRQPDAFHEAWRQARALIIPPIRVMLTALARDSRQTAIAGVEFNYDAARFVPLMEVMPELWQLPVRSNTLPPADRTNAMIVGPFLLDPSPADEAELERLIRTMEAFAVEHHPVEALFLTHHHPDHHQFANVLARRLGLPIHLSEDTQRRIEGRKGRAYFEGIALHHRRDGEVLTRWRGEEVLVIAVPGHDEGQLALAPRGMAWFFVGDLIQGVGTVVISAPEGHMGRYFQTLEKVIALDPGVIIPSHGIAMGSTYRLRATLAHRREREREVLRLHREGLAKREILDTIYQGLDQRLRPLAMANIEAHLTKLREEGLG